MGHQRRRPTTTRTSRRYPSTGTIAYQGRLADSAGTPITETVNMEFRLYDVADGGAPLWSELWTGSNAVRVSDGLFNVMLGSLEPIPQAVVAGHDQLYLGITVGTDDEMMPRVQLGSVPFAVQALTVPDGSVSTAKLANGAVTIPHLNTHGPGEITTTVTSTSEWSPFSPTNFTMNDITTYGGDLLIFFNGSAQNSVSGGQLYVDIQIDGVSVSNAAAGVQVHSAPAAHQPLPFNIMWYEAGVTAGTHTITLVGKVNTGEGKINIQDLAAQFGVVEIKR